LNFQIDAITFKFDNWSFLKSPMKIIFVICLFLICSLAKIPAQTLYPFLVSEKGWGYVDENLKVIIQPQYSFVHPFIDGVAAVERNGLWGFIDVTGRALTKFLYIDLGESNDGLIPVCNKTDKWGFIDLHGKVQIPFIYEQALSFNHSLAPVRLAGKYGYIDRKGDLKIESKYFFAGSFNDSGFAHVATSLNNAFIIDTLGVIHEYLGSLKYELPREGTFQKMTNHKWGFYDLFTRENIIPNEYDLVYHFNDGLAPVRKNGKWGYIDKNNNLVINYLFDDAGTFSEGLAAVRIANRKGYIDRAGSFIFEPQFDSAGEFKHGVAEVAKDGKYFYVNSAGDLLIK
jgi:hypothetical protein